MPVDLRGIVPESQIPCSAQCLDFTVDSRLLATGLSYFHYSLLSVIVEIVCPESRCPNGAKDWYKMF